MGLHGALHCIICFLASFVFPSRHWPPSSLATAPCSWTEVGRCQASHLMQTCCIEPGTAHFMARVLTAGSWEQPLSGKDGCVEKKKKKKKKKKKNFLCFDTT